MKRWLYAIPVATIVIIGALAFYVWWHLIDLLEDHL